MEWCRGRSGAIIGTKIKLTASTSKNKTKLTTRGNVSGGSRSVRVLPSLAGAADGEGAAEQGRVPDIRRYEVLCPDKIVKPQCAADARNCGTWSNPVRLAVA